jgi:hypothetical protein
MSCGAASRCWRLSGPRKVWTQDAAGQGRALVVLNGVAGLARRPAISPSKRRTVRRAGEGLREAVLREMPDPLERIDVLENGSVIVKSRRSCALLGVPASQFGIARWNCVAVPARPWLAVPRVDHAEGTLWFSLPGGLSATLGK